MSLEPFDEDDLDAHIERWLTDPGQETWAWFYAFLLPRVRYDISPFSELIDTTELEDLASVIVQKILSRLHKFERKKGKFVTWVKTVAQNSVRDYLRKRKPVYVDSHDETLPVESDVALLTPEDIMEMHGWIPWRIEHRAIQRIADIFVHYKGRVTRAAVMDVSDSLTLYRVDYHTWASATQVTQFLFALIRLVKSQEVDRERLRRALRRYKDSTPLGLVIKRCGVDVAIELLVLFGGAEIGLPDIATVLSVRT